MPADQILPVPRLVTRGGEALHIRYRARFPGGAGAISLIVKVWMDLLTFDGKPHHIEYADVVTGTGGTLIDTSTLAGSPIPHVPQGVVLDAGIDVIGTFDTTAAEVDPATGASTWQRGLAPVQLMLDQIVLASAYLWAGRFSMRYGDYEMFGPGGGPGNMRTITGTNPAANTEVSETPPANVIWRLIAFSVVLVQGATQTPTPNLVVDDGTTANRRLVIASQAMAVSTTRTHIWQRSSGAQAPGAPAAYTITDTDVLFINGNLPDDLFLREGDRMRTVTTGIGANSDYAAPIYRVEEYLLL